MTNMINESMSFGYPVMTGLIPFSGEETSYSVQNRTYSDKEWEFAQGTKLIASDFLYKHWNNIISNLAQIKDEEFDEESLPPTENAEENIKYLLHSAFEKLGLCLPIPNFIPTDVGGIEAEWKKGNRYLQLISPPAEDKKPYLFFKEGSDYGIQQFEETDDFIARLKWLIEN